MGTMTMAIPAGTEAVTGARTTATRSTGRRCPGDREAGPRHAVVGQGSRAQIARRRAIYLRRRATVAVLLAVFGMGAGLWAHSAGASGAPEPEMVRVVTVAPGETLWQYAEQIAKPGEDLRDVVSRLREVNGMGSSRLAAGQQLKLPAGE